MSWNQGKSGITIYIEEIIWVMMHEIDRYKTAYDLKGKEFLGTLS